MLFIHQTTSFVVMRGTKDTKDASTYICHINVYLLLPSSFMQYLRVKSEIWDLGTKLGPFWDHFWILVPIWTKSQIWDLIGSTVSFLLNKKFRW